MFEYIADTVVYGWLGLAAEDHLAAALHFFVYDTPKILSLLAIAMFIISVVRSYFPPQQTKAWLSHRHSIVGHGLAALVGVITPFCSCSAVPLFIGFIEAGVPLGVTFSFLIASPMVNEVALIMLLGLFGWKVAVLYMLSGLLIAVIGGWIIGRLRLEHWLEAYVHEAQSQPTELPAVTPTLKERCRAAGVFTREMLAYITPYILVALAIGGFIHGYVPENFLLQYAGRDNPLAVPLVVAIGVPLYNSAAGTVPIVYALMEKGLPLGTVLAFMMAVAGLSLPEMIILRKVLTRKLIAVFVGVLFVAIVFTGYLFNWLI